MLDMESDLKFIACNADEGDSGTFADRMLMEGDPFLLIEAMAIAGLAVGATEGYLYIRSEYPDDDRDDGFGHRHCLPERMDRAVSSRQRSTVRHVRASRRRCVHLR